MACEIGFRYCWQISKVNLHSCVGLKVLKTRKSGLLDDAATKPLLRTHYDGVRLLGVLEKSRAFPTHSYNHQEENPINMDDRMLLEKMLVQEIRTSTSVFPFR